MRFMTLAGAVALLGLSACMTNNGASDAFDAVSSGVGFGDYQRYLRDRESAQRSRTPYSVPPEPLRTAAPIRQAPPPQPVATSTPLAAPMMTGSAVNTQPLPPAQQQASAPPRTQTATPSFGTTPAFDAGPSIRAGVSDEQDFDAVAARESIESDRERIEQQRAQYQIVEVASVPDSSVRAGPNVMEYALRTNHPPGVQQHRRLHPLRWSRWEAACQRFQNQDAAQEAFLAAGGPERDPNHLDPDGDGYACWWDPTPIRQAVRDGQ